MQQNKIAGGYGNSVTESDDVVAGGYENTALGEYTTVVGGRSNRAFGDESSTSICSWYNGGKQ